MLLTNLQRVSLITNGLASSHCRSLRSRSTSETTCLGHEGFVRAGAQLGAQARGHTGIGASAGTGLGAHGGRQREKRCRELLASRGMPVSAEKSHPSSPKHCSQASAAAEKHPAASPSRVSAPGWGPQTFQSPQSGAGAGAALVGRKRPARGGKAN